MGNINWLEILNATLDTLQMTGFSVLFSYAVGLPLGVVLVTTQKGGILQNKVLNGIVGTIVNILRSIPFVILIIVLIPFTRLVVGTSLGTAATIVPLTVGSIPIVARMVEASLKEVDPGIVEAARSMGASKFQIIRLFLLPEALPSLLLGLAINTATIIGYSAMAGIIGGGGLGTIALNYGYYRYKTDILLITVILLVVLIQLTQEIGIRVSTRIRHT